MTFMYDTNLKPAYRERLDLSMNNTDYSKAVGGKCSLYSKDLN